jgi:hypothetical protein
MHQVGNKYRDGRLCMYVRTFITQQYSSAVSLALSFPQARIWRAFQKHASISIFNLSKYWVRLSYSSSFFLFFSFFSLFFFSLFSFFFLLFFLFFFLSLFLFLFFFPFFFLFLFFFCATTLVESWLSQQ